MKASDYVKRCVQALGGLAVALLPLGAHSGTLTGTVSVFQYNRAVPNVVEIHISGSHIGPPACAAAALGWMVIDVSTPVGRALYSNLLAIKLSDPARIITLYGANTCDLYGGMESVSYTII